MNDEKTKNSFSFNIKILNNENYKYRKLKNIFIRKQDIYLIKLLQKRVERKNPETHNINYASEDSIKNFETMKINGKPNIKKNQNSYKNIPIIKNRLRNNGPKFNCTLNCRNEFDIENKITSNMFYKCTPDVKKKIFNMNFKNDLDISNFNKTTKDANELKISYSSLILPKYYTNKGKYTSKKKLNIYNTKYFSEKNITKKNKFDKFIFFNLFKTKEKKKNIVKYNIKDMGRNNFDFIYNEYPYIKSYIKSDSKI